MRCENGLGIGFFFCYFVAAAEEEEDTYVCLVEFVVVLVVVGLFGCCLCDGWVVVIGEANEAAVDVVVVVVEVVRSRNS